MFRGTVPGTPIQNTRAILRIRFKYNEPRVDSLIAKLRERIVDGTQGQIPFDARETAGLFSGADLTLLVQAKVDGSSALAKDLSVFWNAKLAGAGSLKFDRLAGRLRPEVAVYSEFETGVAFSGGRIRKQWREGQGMSSKSYYLTLEKEPDSSLTGSTIDLFGLALIEVEEIKRCSEVCYKPAMIALPAAHPGAPPAAHLPVHRSGRPVMFYTGILLLLAVQLFRANTWAIPFLDGYGTGFAIGWGVMGTGAAWACIVRQNGSLGVGIFLSAFAALAWAYGWVLPVIGTFHLPLYLGLFLMALGTVPGLMGLPCLLIGGITLAVLLWTAFTTGLAGVPAVNWLVALVLIAVGGWMVRRQEHLNTRGWLVRT